MKKNVKSIALTLAACIMAGSVAVGGTIAFMSDGEQAVNTITSGDVTVDQYEPNFPQSPPPLQPHQEIPKDPQIENTGENDAIVFMVVQSPVGNVTLVDMEGQKGETGVTDLFYFKQAEDDASVHETNWNDTWIYLEDRSSVSTTVDTPSTYVFAYPHVLKTEDDPETEDIDESNTVPLFDKVQLKSFLEGEISSSAQQEIVVKSYAIQATNVLKLDNGVSVDLTDSLTENNLYEIYDLFVNQLNATS